ncbi:hypothetical protein [Bacteroides clarus]|uniref:Uncharacterized protein n=1 Tax=Bacteroides clarus TaxID=626929 RepID=A0A1Y3YRJ6_9BACE|nr:hypothetical protein [Bacteroides clarus]OUO00484.1 hypothetical protein B5F97_12170 [Bacteroides clarus]
MNPITIPNITIPVIGLPTIGIPSVGFPSASDGGLVWPKGLKESIKAIYDPASQGMTNYDVIEAYAEDFTNWTLDNSNGIATVIKNEIHITESIVYYRSVVRQDKVRGTQPFKVLISGLTDSQAVQYIYNDGKSYVTKKLTTNGVHELPASSTQRNGFNVEPAGACDVTIKQLPTSMLQDLSGNGNHAYLYGGKGKLNSGMGVYQIDFTSYSKTSVVADVSHNTVKVVPAANNYLFVRYATTEMPAYTVNVQNLGNNVLTYQYATENGRQEITLTEGINEIPESIKAENPYQVGFYVSAGTGEITITQIPDYPNQLCYDGKMYAVCYGFPILTDYTVMADRTWFELTANSAFISKAKTSNNGAFLFELYQEREHVLSFGQYNDVSFEDGVITYQTKNTYNGTNIQSGTSSDENVLYIGKIRDNTTAGFNGCHGKIIIADRSFTEDEITWLKDNWGKI